MRTRLVGWALATLAVAALVAIAVTQVVGRQASAVEPATPWRAIDPNPYDIRVFSRCWTSPEGVAYRLFLQREFQATSDSDTMSGGIAAVPDQTCAR